jgi:sterol 14-demethylase
MNAEYRNVNNQRKWNSDEVSGLLIALLMAGQHTSSTTSSWFGFFMCQNGMQDKLLAEQVKVRGPVEKPVDGPISLEDLEKMPLLHACLRETLRLRPPIMQLMRKVRKELKVTTNGKEYIIPAGNQICVSPSANGRNPNEWENATAFDPQRFIDSEGKVTKGEHLEAEGKNLHKWVPFGAGRHRCIGFEFAQIQIRCVWATVLRKFELELPDGKFPAVNYRTMIHTPLDPMINYKRRVPKGTKK